MIKVQACLAVSVLSALAWTSQPWTDFNLRLPLYLICQMKKHRDGKDVILWDGKDETKDISQRLGAEKGNYKANGQRLKFKNV